MSGELPEVIKLLDSGMDTGNDTGAERFLWNKAKASANTQRLWNNQIFSILKGMHNVP